MNTVPTLLTHASTPGFPVESNLKAGVAKADITPPLSEPIYGHTREVNAIRDPLAVGVLLLDDGHSRAAIVTHDLAYSWDGLVQQVREIIKERTGTPAANVLVAASHNHSAPRWTAESSYGREVIRKLSDAVAAVAESPRPVSVGYGEGLIDFNMNRRQVVSGRSVVRYNPDGPVDRRVKVLRFDDGRSLDPLAVLMHASCHPCVFTMGDRWTPPYPKGVPYLSADFPGEAARFVESVYGAHTKALFLQGCSGDVRPHLPGFPYRCGDEADIRWIGRGLGCEVVQVCDRLAVREQLAARPKIYPIKCATKTLMLPGKKAPVRCELQAMRIGPYLLLVIPGEPLTQYAFNIERAIADRAIPIVVGYANGGEWYVCTRQAYTEGGYEPNWTPLAPEAEAVILKELETLADRVIGDTFEAFIPAFEKDEYNTPSIPEEQHEANDALS
jgi:hypothetical protein